MIRGDRICKNKTIIDYYKNNVQDQLFKTIKKDCHDYLSSFEQIPSVI